MFTSLWVIGRLRKQTLLTAAVALMALLMVPLSLLPSFPVYLGLYALVGVAYAYMDAIASSMIADLHPGKNSARMMCVMHACHGLSGIVSPLLLGAMLGSSGNMPRAYLTILAIGLFTVAVLWPANARIRLSDAAARPEPLTRAQLVAFFRDPALRALAICILFYGIHLSGMIVWIDRYVDVGLQSALGALALAFLYAGLTLSRLIVPLLRVKPLTYISASCALGAIVLAAGLCASNAAVMCGCVLACSLLCGALIPVALGTALRRFCLQHAAGFDADESLHAGRQLRLLAADRHDRGARRHALGHVRVRAGAHRRCGGPGAATAAHAQGALTGRGAYKSGGRNSGRRSFVCTYLLLLRLRKLGVSGVKPRRVRLSSPAPS